MAYNSNGQKKDYRDMTEKKKEGARARRMEDKYFATMEGWEEGGDTSGREEWYGDYRTVDDMEEEEHRARDEEWSNRPQLTVITLS